MKNSNIHKRKIINDPIYGLINMPSEIMFDLIEHPYFQRLRRIKQLGMTNFVYPAANHTRFQHAIGATHLMQQAIEVIRSKGHEITEQESEAVSIAILLHDIGHGPFSHCLENDIIKDITHEYISALFMRELNRQFEGRLSMALEIFFDRYSKRFLYQLVSSQLDMDRLDYLNRDSFFTGVTEGVIGSDRIIKMLDVVNDQLVVEAKGIYSIEKFLIARRLMYWQVYLHKTVVSADQLLTKILKRAKELANSGVDLFASPALKFFLFNQIDKKKLEEQAAGLDTRFILDKFSQLDDYDIMQSIKVWTQHSDPVLSKLSDNLINRHLFKIEMSKTPFNNEKIRELKEKLEARYQFSPKEAGYFVFSDSISNNAYSFTDDRIAIKLNSGEIVDISKASDMLNVSVLSKEEKKYFLCYPKQF